MATKYVSSKFGNNANGGTSLKDSYQTTQYGLTAAGGSNVYVYEGKYLEQNLSFTGSLTGIGKVIFDGTIFNQFTTGLTTKYFRNLEIRNYLNLYQSVGLVNDYSYCFILNCGLPYLGNGSFQLQNSLIKSNKDIYPSHYTGGAYNLVINNSSFAGTGKFTIALLNTLSLNTFINNIFWTKPIDIVNVTSCKIQFQHFYSCTIDITADSVGAVLYDGSSGKTLADLRARAAAYYGGVAADYFPNCQVYDASTTDCFVDASLDVKEGFYLKPTSPSATVNYITGKHIGALPVARGLIFPTGYTYGSNIQADGTLLDPDDNTPANNTIEYTNPFDHSKVILVENWGEGIIQAERNGDVDSLDRDTDIDANLLSDGDTLTNSEVYVCEVESLSISDGSTTKNYAVGENCLVPATGTWTISATSGVMRKLFTTKPAVINVMFSRTDATLAVSGETSYAYGDATKTPAYLRFYVNPYNGVTAKNPMCILDADGIPVLGDADTGFLYTGHALGNAVRVQLRYEKRKSIIQVENAKS